MSRVTLIAALAVGTAGVAAAGLPYYTGVVAHREFNAAFEQVQNSPYATARLTGYERGWFKAEAASELVFRVEDETYTFPFQHTISHGWASARVTTVSRMPAEASERIRSLFGDELFTAVTTVRPNGNQQTVLNAPALQAEAADMQGRLDWGGVAGTIDLEGDRLLMDIQVPHLRLTADDGHMTLEGMAVTGDLNQFAPGLWLGPSRVAVDVFDMDAPAEDATRVAFRLGDIELVQDQREDGADLFGFDMGVHVGELIYDGDTRWTDFAWDSEVRNVDRAAYIALVDELGRAADPNASPEKFGLQMAQTMSASMESFLARSPQIAFKRIGVTGPSGSFDAALVVGFDGEGSFELSPPDMIARVSAQANARIPKPMLEQILAQTAMVSARSVAEQYPDATEEQIAQVSEQIRQGQQQQLEASGLLAADGDDYTLDASFAGGSLVVNGVSMNGLLGH